MPLSSAGCYAQPPATSRRPSSASLASSQGNIRPKKVKTYAAYSVSKSVGKILTFVLILFNLLLVVLSYVSYKKALKTNFPVSRGQAYVISGDQYG